MIVKEIDELIKRIYRGDFMNINNLIIDMLSNALALFKGEQNDIIEIMKVLEVELPRKNYIYIADILQFELRDLILEVEHGKYLQ